MKTRGAFVFLLFCLCFSCKYQLDIRELITNEVARDYSNQGVNYSMFATATDGKIFVPSEEVITARIEVVNPFNLSLNAKIEPIDPAHQSYFSDFPTTIITDVYSELVFDFSLKLEADASATSLGKEIPCRAILTNPENDNKEFGIKYFTIRCNTAPPVIPQLVLCIDRDSARYALIFEVPQSELSKKQQKDITHLVFVRKEGNTETKTEFPASSISNVSSGTDIVDYVKSNFTKLFQELPDDLNGVFSYLTKDESTNTKKRKTYSLYYKDEQGLFTKISCSTKLLQLENPTLKDSEGKTVPVIKDFTISTDEHFLPYPVGMVEGAILRAFAPKKASVDGQLETVGSPVSLTHTLVPEQDPATPSSPADLPADGRIVVPGGVYQLTIYASANGYESSKASFRVTMQDSVYIDFGAGSDRISVYGCGENACYNNIPDAKKRLQTIHAKQPNIPLTLVFLSFDPPVSSQNLLDNLPQLNVVARESVDMQFSDAFTIGAGKTVKLSGSWKNRIVVENGATCVLGASFELSDVVAGEEWGSIYNAGTLEMQNGAQITSCSSKHGGAVYNTGTFTLSGGAISDCYNTVTQDNYGNNILEGMGGAIYNAGTLNMTGGEISACGVKPNEATATTASATDKGGGIYNAANAKFNFSGGKIIKCQADYSNSDDEYAGSGGAIYNAGELIITGSAILGGSSAEKNISTNYGGAIFNSGTLFLGTDTAAYTGDISYNGAFNGSGIYCAANSNTYFYSGTIKNNMQLSDLGDYAIYVSYNANFTMYDTSYVDSSTTIWLGNNVEQERVLYNRGSDVKYAFITLGNYTGKDGMASKLMIHAPPTGYESATSTGKRTFDPKIDIREHVILKNATATTVTKFEITNRNSDSGPAGYKIVVEDGNGVVKDDIPNS